MTSLPRRAVDGAWRTSGPASALAGFAWTDVRAAVGLAPVSVAPGHGELHVWRISNHEHLYRFAGGNVPLFLVCMAARWAVVNLVCDLMARGFPGRVVRVRFEDLCAQTTSELDRIGRAFGLDLADVRSKAARREPLVVGHNIAGNRVRHADTVRFDPGGVTGPAAVAALAGGRHHPAVRAPDVALRLPAKRRRCPASAPEGCGVRVILGHAGFASARCRPP